MTGRRLLLATAVAHYPRAPLWDRPGLVAAREEIVRLFTGTFGYTLLPDLALDPTAGQLTTALRNIAKQADPSDHVVVYIAGHGETLDDTGDHVLLTADTDPDDIAGALPTATLARQMLLGTPVQRLLLLLDTCYSGKGTDEIAAAALTGITRNWDSSISGGFVVVSSALPAEQAETGIFPRLLGDAVGNLATAGYDPPALSIGALVTAMNDSPARPGYQRIGWTPVGLTGEVPEFLPNPRHHETLSDIDLHLQQVTEGETQAERREVEYRRRFLPRAMGGPTNRPDWWFTGRHQALTAIARWLDDNGTGSALVVTGGPGSGKTAVLGLISTLADKERRRTVPLDALSMPDAAVPPLGSIDVTIYAAGLTTEQVLAGLAAAARVPATTVTQFAAALTGRTKRFTALIDALDEAADPRHLVTHLLSPLLEHARDRVRLLLGSRAHLVPLLGHRIGDPVDLDDPEYADQAALTSYAIRNLLEAALDSPYLSCPAERTRGVAAAVAAAAAPSFLVARIVSGTLAAEPVPADPSNKAWRDGLPRLATDAIRKDLDRRLGSDAQRARDLLRPLAFAEGQGLPWENIWAALASRISGIPYTDEDIRWLRSSAGSYFVEATEAGRSAYRLYHQAMTEYLRSDTDADVVDGAFVDVLEQRVPRDVGGRRDWTRAHPYTLRHLATHAARAARIDELVADPDYLVHALPSSLIPAIWATATEQGLLIRTIYLTSAHEHRDADAVTRRQLLAIDAARCGADAQRAALSAPLPWRPRWASGTRISGSLRATLTGHDTAVTALTCTVVDDVPVAVSASKDGTVRVWDLNTATARAVIPGWARGVACTTLEGVRVAVICGSREIRVWNLSTGTLRATLTSDTWLTGIACVDDIPVAVTPADDGTVLVWDLAAGALRATLPGHSRKVLAVACARLLDGTPAAITTGADFAVKIWDLDAGKERATLPGDQRAYAVGCSSIEGVPAAVTLSGRDTAQVWDLTAGKLRSTLASEGYELSRLACTEVGGEPVVVTVALDGTIRIWDLAAGTLRATIPGHDSMVLTVACAMVDGRPVAVTGSGSTGDVRVLDLTAPTSRAERGRDGRVAAVACTAVGGLPVAVTCADDGTPRMWDLATGSRLSTLDGHEGRVSEMVCTEVNGLAMAVVAGERLEVWDLVAGRLSTGLHGHVGWVSAVACTVLNGAPVAISGGDDGTVRVWDLAVGDLRATLHERRLPGRFGIPYRRAWVSAAGCALVDHHPVVVVATGGGYDSGALRVWDLVTSRMRGTLSNASGWINAVACVEVNGVPVAVTGSHDGTVQVWDLARFRLRAELAGQGTWIGGVACTVLGTVPVAIVGGGRTVRVWNLSTCTEALSYATPYGVGCITVGPFNEIVVGSDREVITFDPPSIE